ncbi:MAG: hypothetical protein F9K44_10010 [Hyphomicrobiaceae bacterium]|nr:MAG: hypothetical protein F9K44_10010 [Hyphomicrobiaceae bacterium]
MQLIFRLLRLVSNPVYGGRWHFNAIEARSRKRKGEIEHVYADAPAIIEPAAVPKWRAVGRFVNWVISEG